MKTLAYFLFNFFFLTHFAFDNSVNAQSEDNDQVKITIKQNVNGEVTESMSTFSLDDFNIDEIMQQLGSDLEGLEISLEELKDEFGDLDIDIDVDIEGLENFNHEFGSGNAMFINDDGKKVVIVSRDVNPDRGFLGVVPALAENGILVEHVVPGSSAEKAGIVKGDILREVNDKTLAGPKDLLEALADSKKGENIEIEYERSGKMNKTNAVLGERPADMDHHIVKKCIPNPSCVPPPNCAKPEHGFLGIHMDKSENGVLVTEVVEGSAAEKAGLLKGDVVKKLGSTDIKSAEDVYTVMKSTKPGDKLEVRVVRDSKEKKFTAELGEHKDFNANVWKSIKIERPFLGVNLSEDLDQANGVKVIKVVEGSAAEKAGVLEGDLIKSVDNVKVSSLEEVIHELRSHKSGDVVEILVDRDGSVMNLNATLESKEFSHCGPKMMWKQDSDDVEINLSEEDMEKHIRIRMQEGDEIIEKLVKIEKDGDGVKFDVMEDEATEPTEINQKKTMRTRVTEKSYEGMNVDNLSLFPNPNSGQFRLTFTVAEASDMEITILDNQGKTVYNEVLEGFSGSYDNPIDLSEVATGTYIMQITQGDKRISEKIVIQ